MLQRSPDGRPPVCTLCSASQGQPYGVAVRGQDSARGTANSSLSIFPPNGKRAVSQTVSSSASRVQVNDLLSWVVLWFPENRIFAPCSASSVPDAGSDSPVISAR